MNFLTSIAKKSTFVLIIALFSAVSASAFTPGPVTSVIYQSIKLTSTAKSITLDWSTASEVGNSYFEVERSANMIDFKTVALVLDGFATEGTGKKYAYKENAPANGKVAYYRLKQFDAYGNITYSEIFKVQ